MSAFWLVAALFVAGALAWLLPPLWRPSPPAGGAEAVNLALRRREAQELEAEAAQGLVAAERLDEARADLRQRVLEEADAGATPTRWSPARRSALALALLLPLASVLTYLQLGLPQAATPTLAAAPAAAGADAHRMTPEQIVARVAALAERLRQEPDNVEGWRMLGRSYTALGRYRDGAAALRRASELAPQDADLLADLADVTAMVQGKRLAGEPARLVQRALDVDPRHVKALALAGSVAFEAQDYAAAQTYWQRLVEVLPPGSEIERSVRGSLLEARQMEARASGSAAPGATATPVAAPGGGAAAAPVGAVSGRVTLSPALAARLQAGDTLFVFARAAEGPRMPLAVLRQPWDGQPLSFKLDDAMAMSPQLKLSMFPQVVVGARVSRGGGATPQAGDLVGQSAPVAPGASGLEIVIDRVQP